MKKKIAIAIITASVLISCATEYRTNSYSNTSTSSYKKKGIEYRITRTYTSTIVIDTIKTK